MDSGLQRGYSLYELVITLALVGLVLTIGVPTFGGMTANARLRTEANALFHAVHVARKESIVRRRVVTICPTGNGSDCSDTFEWQPQFMMFVNEDRDWPASRDPDEAILQRFTFDPTVRVVANRRSFSLRSTDLRATNGTLILCDRAQRARSRALVVSYTGRPRIAYEDRAGNPYECTD